MIMKNNYFITITGRPNSGKSSLINYLSHSKQSIGKYAGTTVRISPIPLVRNLHLVDFPGFGRIMKRSKKEENQIKDDIILFLEKPPGKILFPVHIIDSSTFHKMVESLEKKGIIPIDIEMITFLAEVTRTSPFIVFNKADKVSEQQQNENLIIMEKYHLPETRLYEISLKTKQGCSLLKKDIKKSVIDILGKKYQQWD